MAYNDSEISEESGSPVFLYEFDYYTLAPGDPTPALSKSWYFTDADRPVVSTLRDVTYEPQAIQNSAVRVSGDASTEDMRITLPVAASLAEYLRLNSLSGRLKAAIWKTHLVAQPDGTYTMPAYTYTDEFDEEVSEDDRRIIWAGSVKATNRGAQNSVVLVCNTRGSELARGGLRLTWSRNCPHMHYGLGCNLSPASFGLELLLPITIVDGTHISCPEMVGTESGEFDGGFLLWSYEDSGGLMVYERRGIERQLDDGTITVFGSTLGMDVAGAAFTAYPGCRRTPEDCNTRYNNIANYGGVVHMQGKSPFDGNQVF